MVAVGASLWVLWIGRSWVEAGWELAQYQAPEAWCLQHMVDSCCMLQHEHQELGSSMQPCRCRHVMSREACTVVQAGKLGTSRQWDGALQEGSYVWLDLQVSALKCLGCTIGM